MEAEPEVLEAESETDEFDPWSTADAMVDDPNVSEEDYETEVRRAEEADTERGRQKSVEEQARDEGERLRKAADEAREKGDENEARWNEAMLRLHEDRAAFVTVSDEQLHDQHEE